jgi:type I restriction enzyme S subunit
MAEQVLPDGWKTVRLGDMVSLIRNTVDPRAESKLPYVGLEHIDSAQVDLVRWGNATEVTSTKSRFSKQDILYGKLRPYLDKAVIAPIDGICSTDILVLHPQNGILPQFIAQILHTPHFVSYANSTATGIHHPRTSWNAIKEFELALPPTSEQTEIARILNFVQQARKASERTLEIAFDLRKSVLQHLFSYGPTAIDDVKRVSLVDTALGPLPKHWSVATLKSVAKSYKNGIYKKAEFYGRGVPSIRMFNIREGVVNSEGAPLLEVTKEELEDFGLRETDILINRVNSGDLVGKTGIVPRGLGLATFESKNIRVRVDVSKVVPTYFVMWTLTSHYVSQIRQMVRAAVGQATVNQGDLDRIAFPLPPLEEQRKSVQVFQAVESKIRTERNRRDSLTEVLKSLSVELLSGKYRGSNKAT